MSRIRTAVVDDEKPARVRLLELLRRQPDIDIVATAADGRETLDVLSRLKVDLLLLDVQMPQLDGLAVLRHVAPEQLPVTILVTAYDRYAVQAFDAHAIDYLLKPFSDQRFEDAIKRARRYLAAADSRERAEELSAAAEERTSVDTRSGCLERLVLRANGAKVLLDVTDIDWIEAAGVYVYIHAAGKKHLYRSSLTQLLQRLEPQRFVRIHRSAAVNTSRIQELRPLSHGDYTVLLKSATELTLSRAHRKYLEEWLRQSI